MSFQAQPLPTPPLRGDQEIPALTVHRSLHSALSLLQSLWSNTRISSSQCGPQVAMGVDFWSVSSRLSLVWIWSLGLLEGANAITLSKDL